MDFGFSNFFIKKKPKQPKYIIPGSQSQIPSCMLEEALTRTKFLYLMCRRFAAEYLFGGVSLGI